MSTRNYLNSLVQQHDESDCGPACLASVLRYYNYDVSLEDLRVLTGTNLTGTSLWSLSQAARLIGFDSEGFTAETSDLMTLQNPVVLHISTSSDGDHYVVLYEYKHGSFFIGDPASGICKVTEVELATIWKSKKLLTLNPTTRIKLETTKSTGPGKFWNLIRHDRDILFTALTLGLVITTLNVASAIFSQTLIDEIIPTKSIQKLFLGAIIFGLTLFIKAGFNYARNLILIRQGCDFNIRTIESFVTHLLRLPKVFFDSRKTGEVIARLNDSFRIQNTVTYILGDIVIDGLIVLTSLVAIFYYSPQNAALAVVFCMFYLILFLRINPALKASQKSVLENYSKNESNYIDILQGIEAIKGMQKEKYYGNKATSVHNALQNSILKLGKVSAEYSALSNFLGAILLGTSIALASYLTHLTALQVGSLVAIISLIGSVVSSMDRIITSSVSFQEAQVALQRLDDFMSMKTEFSITQSLYPKSSNETKLELSCVSFSFSGGRSLLTDITLSVNQGEIVGLIGESGCGKSTLLQIIQQFYSHDGGEITINGLNTKLLSVEQVRSVFGVAPQHVKIFSATVIENISLDDPQSTSAQVFSFCKDYGFDKYFTRFHCGYDTVLSDQGINISGGQRQLLGLARALYKMPKILLLDEVTSAMDQQTEQFVLELLEKCKRQMGILLISHRIKPLAITSKVYLLKNGKTELIDPTADDIRGKISSANYLEC